MKKWILPAIILFAIGAASCGSEEPQLDPIYATVEIQIPCTDPLHIEPPPESASGGPFLMADPQCGALAEEFDAPGTEITLYGSGFYPNTETTLKWEDTVGNEFRQRQDGEYATPVTDQEGEFSFSLSMPYRVLPPSITDDYVVWKLTAFQGEPVEEEIAIEWDALLEHLYISMAGGVIGIGIGFVLGYLLADGEHSLLRSNPSLRYVGFFIPSRTLLVSLLMHLIFPAVLIVQFGFGAKSGLIWTSLASFILTFFLCSTLYLWRWENVSFASRLISTIRTLAVFSVFFTTWLGYFGMGGVARLVSVHIALFEYDVALRYYLLIVLMLLVFDLLGGVVAFLLNRREERSQAVSAPEG